MEEDGSLTYTFEGFDEDGNPLFGFTSTGTMVPGECPPELPHVGLQMIGGDEDE